MSSSEDATARPDFLERFQLADRLCKIARAFGDFLLQPSVGPLQLVCHAVEMVGEIRDLILRLHFDAMAELARLQLLGTDLQGANRNDHFSCQKHPGQDGQEDAQCEQPRGAEQQIADPASARLSGCSKNTYHCIRGTVAEAADRAHPVLPEDTGSASDLTRRRPAEDPRDGAAGVVAECASSSGRAAYIKASLSVPICSGVKKLDKNLRLISATVEPASRPECGIAIDMKGSGPSK